MNIKQIKYLKILSIILLVLVAGMISYPNAVRKITPVYNFLNGLKINLGLDLQGGIHLEYAADTANIESEKINEALQGAQDVIERRVNAFGVGEPLVQVSSSGNEHRIIVELPGIKDIEEAKKKIKETPYLEFREEADSNNEDVKKIIDPINEQFRGEADGFLKKVKSGDDFATLAKENSQDPGSRAEGGDLGFVKRGQLVAEFDKVIFDSNLKNGEIHPDLVETQFGWHIIKKEEERGDGDEREVRSRHILFAKASVDMFPDLKYKATNLTGKNLKNASMVFADQGLSDPQVSLQFDEEGAKIFAELTKKNIGKTIAIYLDGKIISAPVVQTEITNGEAVITGNFSVDEAKQLSMRLTQGALPVPLKLASQQSIEASLGKVSLEESLRAGLYGVIAVMVFVIIYYRFLGLVASFSLVVYIGMMVSLFKLSGYLSPWPITLTLSGIAGFILSIGMAVDANVLIFERTREELENGRSLKGAIDEGFRRAWTSIRDGNYSTILTSMILIWVGTGFIKGFAVILVLGVLMSMFTAIVLTRNILQLSIGEWLEKRLWLISKIKQK